PENGVCIQDAACSPGQVDTQSCGYLLNGTSTKSRTCASNGQWGNFSSCITNCNSGYHPENGVCTQDGICTPGQQESQSCSIANGSGSQTRTCGNDRYWGSWSSVCSPTSCYYNYHKENDSCILNEKSCSISNGAGKQYWQGSYWGTCTVIGCNSGYIQSGNSCVQQSALEIISGSTSYGSMTTWPYDSNVFKAVSVINASGNLVVTISKTNGAGLTNPGWYTVYDNTTGNGITSGTYSGGSIISITISRSWLKIGDNRLKIRLNTDPPINAVSVSDTEIKVKRNY
ncbi:MAG: hypothetical protein KDK45_21985, partial [Leptospiraceae bacterium]|nr:hypothetical protein [Leptospiraceae bacterium]